MIIPIVIGALWLIAAALFSLDRNLALAAISALVSPISLALTMWLRRKKMALAARKYLAEGARDGAVTIDTDDLPSWPFPVIFVLALGGIAAAIASIVML